MKAIKTCLELFHTENNVIILYKNFLTSCEMNWLEVWISWLSIQKPKPIIFFLKFFSMLRRGVFKHLLHYASINLEGHYILWSSLKKCLVRIRIMVFNATFNNISVISWRSVLLVEKTIDLPQVTDKLYHKTLHRTHLAWALKKTSKRKITEILLKVALNTIILILTKHFFRLLQRM
jgi:hypothetical protein